MTIYLITNLINGKQYVGQTISSISKRWRYHQYSNSGCVALSNSIKKHGKENFKIEAIFHASSLEELSKKESEFISKLGTLHPTGYNLTSGGERPVYSKESRDKMSKSHIGKVISKETKKKMSESHMGQKKPDGFSETMSKIKDSIKIKIFCDQTGTVYESISLASKITGINSGHIQRIVKGTLKQSKGHTFKAV